MEEKYSSSLYALFNGRLRDQTAALDMEMKQQMIKNSRSFKGSATVEAALLMPFLIFLIWNILYLAFFLYDQSTSLQGSYCTALRAERHYGTEEEKESLAEKKYELAVRKKLVEATVSHTIELADAVTVETKTDMRVPTVGFFMNRWHGAQKQRAEKWQPVAFIRNCRRAGDIAELLKAQN